MAKVYDLVKAEGFASLATEIRNATASGRQLVSQYLVSNLHHFHRNGKKVDVLQEAVDTILSERYRDLEVIEIAIRALTPVSFNTEAPAGSRHKKWINIEGEKAPKEGADEKAIKKRNDENKARWLNVFEKFAKGEEIAVDNPEFYKGCNDGKPVNEQIEAREMENFSQNIYALVDRLKEIQHLKNVKRAEREGAPSDAVEALSLKVGTVKKSLDSNAKKLKETLDLVTVDYVNNASESELDSLEGYADELEKRVQEMQAQILIIRGRVTEAASTLNERKQREEEEAALAKAAAIMARRNEQAQQTTEEVA